MKPESNPAKRTDRKHLDRREKYLESLFQDNVGLRTGVLISKGLRDESGLKPGVSIGENPVTAHLPSIQNEKTDNDHHLPPANRGNN